MMGGKAIWLGLLGGMVLTGLITNDGSAGERTRSGEYSGRKTSGTFERKVNRQPGQVKKDTTWQNQKGQGTRHSERNWDKDSGKGTYSSSTTRPDGTTTSRSGTVQKNPDGSVSQQGTITGPKGKTTQVERDTTRQEDGSRSVHTTYTGPEDKTLTVDKSVTKTEGGREMTGTYSSSTGKSGTFQSSSSASDGKRTTDRSLTNQDQQTWQRRIETERTGDTVTRNVTATDPEGKQESFQQSVTFSGQ